MAETTPTTALHVLFLLLEQPTQVAVEAEKVGLALQATLKQAVLV